MTEQNCKRLRSVTNATTETGTTTSGAYSMELDSVDGTGKDGEPNPCVFTKYLYSLGLDHTILPKNTIQY